VRKPCRSLDRRSQQQREGGGDGGAEEQHASAELAEVGLPGGFVDKGEAELGDRWLGTVDDLVADEGDRRPGDERRRQADAEERPVAEPVEPPAQGADMGASGGDLNRGRGGGHPAAG
jgi:hypothetical protein